jgi:putative multiple sugar transport system permease protein
VSITASEAPVRPTIAGFLKGNIREYGLLLSLIVIMIFFQVMTNGTLFKPLNLTNLVLQNGYIVIMALGMLLIIVAGHIDLSVGSVCGFIGALAAVMMVDYKMHYIPATIICLIAGGLIGAAQGYWIAYFKIPAFIVTLAGMLVFRGLSLAILQGQSIGPFPNEFQSLSSGFIPDLFAVKGLTITSLVLGTATALLLVYMNYRSRANQLAHGIEEEPAVFFYAKNLLILAGMLFLTWQLSTYKGLPNVLVVMSALIALYVFVTTRTTIGRRVYALGGNEKATKLSGINTERLTFYTFVNMGVLAALAGLVFTARLNTASPKAGVGFELDVIAACFIGGASASGGVGKVVGAVIGAFVMGVMNNGMSILGIGIDWQQVIKGLVLLAAVCFDVYNKNKA